MMFGIFSLAIQFFWNQLDFFVCNSLKVFHKCNPHIKKSPTDNEMFEIVPAPL